jgi:hypothetical protein
MTAKVAFLTCSALLMISHPASTFPNLQFLCEQVRSHGASIGCFVNPHKTRVLISCNGTSILPTLTTHDPPLAHSLSTSIASFSTTPHPTNKTAPDIPVELTSAGLRLLGQPAGSATFASDFFDRHIADVRRNITSLLENISNQQTCLQLFSQCIMQKLPHLLSADVLFHLPTDHPDHTAPDQRLVSAWCAFLRATNILG